MNEKDKEFLKDFKKLLDKYDMSMDVSCDGYVHFMYSQNHVHTMEIGGYNQGVFTDINIQEYINSYDYNKEA